MKLRSKQITMALSIVMMGALFADTEESLISDSLEDFIVDSSDSLISDSLDNLIVDSIGIENFIADSGNKNKAPDKAKKKKNQEKKDYDQFTIFGDFLYWKADVEGTEFAEKGTLVQPTPFTEEELQTRTKTLKADGKWEPGVRLGMGYKFANFDDWDLSLVWTHLNAESKHVSASVSLPNTISPLGIGLLGPAATTACAQWKLDTNILDLEVGRAYFPTRKISLKPHAGVRGAWFDYKFKENFTGQWVYFKNFNTIPLPPPLFFSSPTSGKNSFDYKGIGLKGGMDGSWFLGDQWTIETRFSASLLYGRYEIDQAYNGFQSIGYSGGLPLFIPVVQTLTKEFWRVRTNIEGFLGLMWKMRFDDNKRSFFLSAGYEISQWFQLNEVPTIIDLPDIHTDYDQVGNAFTINNFSLFEFSTHGDVSYQGLTLRAGFEF